MSWKNIKLCLIIILGSAAFAASVNLFIVPLNLYSSGLLGVSQVIRSIIQLIFPFTSGFDFAGIINFCLSVPLYIIAYKSLSKKFFYLSILTTITQTVVLSIVPIPAVPLIDDILTSIIVGALIGGVGIGFCLKVGGSGGGLDIIGMYYALKYQKFSIGKLSIAVNAVVYIVCAVLFDFTVSIYSIIYVAIFSTVLDRFHTRNIVTQCMIFTKKKEVKHQIVEQLKRGFTYWDGVGGYTDEGLEVLVTVISKYEVSALKKMVTEIDPHAFIILTEGSQVAGNYEKRLLNEI